MRSDCALIIFRFGTAGCTCICHTRRGKWHCFDGGCCGREGTPARGNLREVVSAVLRGDYDAK